MTRKDYELIAAALKQSLFEAGDLGDRSPGATVGSRNCIGRLADALAHDNPRFDRTRFLKACGID